MSSGIHQPYRFGRASTKEPGTQQVSMETIGVIAAVVIAFLVLLNAHGNLSREISEGELRIRQTILETERVLSREIGSVREEVQGVRVDLQGIRREIQGIHGELRGVRRELNANHRDLRDLLRRSL